MAEVRETFTILENSSAAGVALVKASDGVEASVGHDSVPTLAFKDSAGDMVRPQLNADGTMPVSFDSGVAASNSAEVTIAALNTEQDVVVLAVAVDDVVNANMAMGSSFQPTVWVLYHNDNASLNELARFVTGPGDFSHLANLSNITFTAGAAGTQELVLRATQLRGGLTQAHGSISLTNLG